MLPSTLRSALDIKKAIEMAPKRLEPIGKCGSGVDRFMKNCRMIIGEEDEEDEEENEEEEEEESEEELQSVDSSFVKKLVKIYNIHGSNHYDGTLSAPFTLTITRPGCDFSGEILPAPARPEDETSGEDPGEDTAARDQITARIQKWFEAGMTSGYGDVRAQETKVDKSVRDAREIPASEFTVSPNLITEIEKSWGEHFIPSTVRAEPYKIHMYGPGGLFKGHKDTPEKDLVGTFLVGLGDTTNPKKSGVLRIGGYYHGHRADEGHWVAFYPDTTHEIKRIKSGYRAVIAFKIFRKEQSQRSTQLYETGPEAVPREKMEKVLKNVTPPYGLLLKHKYCMGTAELSGLDNILHAAAKAVAQRKNAEVHFLPVLTKVTGEMYRHIDWSGNYLKPTISAEAPVFPFTQAHVDALISSFNAPAAAYDSDSDSASDSMDIEDERKDLVDVPNQDKWLVGLKSVPFYTMNFTGSTVVWRRFEEEGVDYTGNEAKPTTEDSIYLSYAMVVLPKKGQESHGVAQPQD